LRIFIAALIPPEIKLAIKNYVESIKPHWSGVRWEAYNKFHITIKFLGELDETRLQDIEEIIKARVQGLPPFRMKISGFAGFPSINRPRVLVVALSRNDGLLRFQQDLEGKFELIGYAKDNRSFRSHITIGRVKGYSSVRGSFPSPDPLSFNISEIAIMRSILHKKGSEYTGLSIFTLNE
jgi:RNA 2',3'-cyclic 3'-phosphodiesterase